MPSIHSGGGEFAQHPPIAIPVGLGRPLPMQTPPLGRHPRRRSRPRQTLLDADPNECRPPNADPRMQTHLYADPHR